MNRPSRALLVGALAAVAGSMGDSLPMTPRQESGRLGGWRHRPGSSKLTRAQKKKRRKIAAASKRRNR